MFAATQVRYLAPGWQSSTPAQAITQCSSLPKSVVNLVAWQAAHARVCLKNRSFSQAVCSALPWCACHCSPYAFLVPVGIQCTLAEAYGYPVDWW